MNRALDFSLFVVHRVAADADRRLCACWSRFIRVGRLGCSIIQKRGKRQTAQAPFLGNSGGCGSKSRSVLI